MLFTETPHKRFNPLTGDWLLVSPHRTKRPWQGQQEQPQRATGPSYDPDCYLCPGNSRASGGKNPDYRNTYVFDNDFSALLPDSEKVSEEEGPHAIIRAERDRGICRVVCFSPRHDLTLSRMPTEQIIPVISAWKQEYRELGSLDFISHVQIFENRGSVMGCSNPHPHCQIWAEESVPNLPAAELKNQGEYFAKYGTSLLLDYLEYERAQKERIVIENEHFTLLVPYWAVWPFETMILPHRDIGSLLDFSDAETESLADLMRRTGIRYDNLFKTSFPYSMGIHQKPTDGQEYRGSLFHLHYLPPLLRSASVKKFMVGYELLAQPQRDITAEMSAKRLRELNEVHFMEEQHD